MAARKPRLESPRPSPARRRRARTAAAVAVLLLLAIVVAAAFAGWYSLYRPQHSIPAGSEVEIVVAKGASTDAIAQQLTEAGIVDNALMFRVTARRSEADGKLKAGTYLLTTGMGYDAAMAELVKGPKIVYTDVPIPEGFTARQIAARVAKRVGVSEDEMLALVTSGAPQFAKDHPYLEGAYRDSLEGYLFPATYRVKEGATPEQIVEMMLDAFDERMAKIDLSYAKSKNLTLNDVVIIASIIEREARTKPDQPKVSSVIYNRLKKKMRLQLCATVVYILPDGTQRVTYSDLKKDDPYNTYRNPGLPPGPISNPGQAALDAAAHPANTTYLYYVLTGKDGSHTFASTNAEFLKAVAVNRKVFSK